MAEDLRACPLATLCGGAVFRGDLFYSRPPLCISCQPATNLSLRLMGIFPSGSSSVAAPLSGTRNRRVTGRLCMETRTSAYEGPLPPTRTDLPASLGMQIRQFKTSHPETWRRRDGNGADWSPQILPRVYSPASHSRGTSFFFCLPHAFIHSLSRSKNKPGDLRSLLYCARSEYCQLYSNRFR